MARFAAERRTPESLRDIEDICQRITTMSERIVVPNYEFIDLIDLYHMAIRRAADSAMEVQRASGYFRFAAFFLMNGKTIDFSDVIRHSNRNRPALTRYIAEGNVERAGEAMKKYILAGAPVDVNSARVG
jgi:DNA-binding FadR family transcriptional regulator